MNKDINFTIEDGQTVVNYTLINENGTVENKKVPYYIDGEVNEEALSILYESKKQAEVFNNNQIARTDQLSTEVEDNNVVDADYEDVKPKKTKVTVFKTLAGKAALVGIGVLIGVGLVAGARGCSAKQLEVDDTPVRQEQNIDELEKVTYVTYEEYINAVNYTRDEIKQHSTSEIEDSEVASYVFVANMERMDEETQDRIISEGLISDSAENVLQDTYQAVDAINSITINATYGGTGHYFDYTQIFANERDKEIATWYLNNLKNARGEDAKKIIDSYYAMLNNDKANTDAPIINNEINAGVYYILNSSAGVMTLEGATSVGKVDYTVYDNFEQNTDMFETSNVLQILNTNCFETKTK